MTDEESPDLPMDEIHRNLEEAVHHLKGKVRNCGRKAFHHLRKAWALYPIDQEMSLFRAITAEEEAATALILALKNRNYPSAQLLNERKHVHKSALIPFLNAVNNFLAGSFGYEPILGLNRDAPPRLSLRFKIGPSEFDKEGGYIEPDHPFNFLSTLAAEAPGTVYSFEQELTDIHQSRGMKDIKSLVEKEANIRNRLLYANDDGIPTVQIPRSLILERRRRVTVLLHAAIGISQTEVHQLFAVQCLQVFLKQMNMLKEMNFDFNSAYVPANWELTISGERESPHFLWSYRHGIENITEYRFDWGVT